MEFKKVDWLVQYNDSGKIIRLSFDKLLDRMKSFSISNVNKHYQTNEGCSVFPASSDEDILFLEVKNLIQKANANKLILDDGTQITLEQLKILLSDKYDVLTYFNQQPY